MRFCQLERTLMYSPRIALVSQLTQTFLADAIEIRNRFAAHIIQTD